MKNVHNSIVLGASALHGKKGRMILMVLTIALFVLAAGAPNATIGIGK